MIPFKEINSPFVLKDSEFAITIEQLNGMTKYPSIYELHQLVQVGKKMKARGPATHSLKDKEFDVTEKMDGTNIRFIIHKSCNELFIGDRNELLAYNHDLLHNNKYGVVEIINKLFNSKHIESFKSSIYWGNDVEFITIYGELFGKEIQKRGKQYGKKSFRVFAIRPLTIKTINFFRTVEREKWHNIRCKNKYIPFYPFGEVLEICEKLKLPTVPYFGTVNINDLQSSEEISEFIEGYVNSEINNANSEGVVIHSLDSSDYEHIKEGETFASFKLKFENYW